MGKFLADLGMIAGGAAVGQIQGMLNDRRQEKANNRNTRRQVEAQKELTDYNQQKALAMWKDTNYAAQKEQMKLAGLNPAMMYGMGGGGGQSTAVSAGSVSAGSAPSSGGEAVSILSMMPKILLLNAERDLLKEQKKTEVVKQMDIAESATGKELENLVSIALSNLDDKGNLLDEEKDPLKFGSVAVQSKLAELKKLQIETIFKGDENKRNELYNKEAIKKLEAEVILLGKQGKTQDEVINNLVKDGKLKDAEISWNEVGLKNGDFGKFIVELIKKLVVARK
jgi:hypothetical protein